MILYMTFKDPKQPEQQQPQQTPHPPQKQLLPQKAPQIPKPKEKGIEFNQEALLRIVSTGEFDELTPVRAIRIQARVGELIVTGQDIPAHLSQQSEMLAKYTPRRFEEYARLAEERSSARNYKGAINAAEKALVCDPEKLEYWVKTGDYAKAAGEKEMAKKYYKLVMRNRSTNPADVRVVDMASRAMQAL